MTVYCLSQCAHWWCKVSDRVWGSSRDSDRGVLGHYWHGGCIWRKCITLKTWASLGDAEWIHASQNEVHLAARQSISSSIKREENIYWVRNCQLLRKDFVSILVLTERSDIMVKVKVKCTLVQTLRLCAGLTAHRRSSGIALLFHGQRH